MARTGTAGEAGEGTAYRGWSVYPVPMAWLPGRKSCCWTLLACLAMPLAASAAPSFSCNDAKTTVEKLIRADDDLSRLDAMLDELYRSAMAEDAQGVQRAQRTWLSARNRCRDRACVESAYIRQIGRAHV